MYLGAVSNYCIKKVACLINNYINQINQNIFGTDD